MILIQIDLLALGSKDNSKKQLHVKRHQVNHFVYVDSGIAPSIWYHFELIQKVVNLFYIVGLRNIPVSGWVGFLLPFDTQWMRLPLKKKDRRGLQTEWM